MDIDITEFGFSKSTLYVHIVIYLVSLSFWNNGIRILPLFYFTLRKFKTTQHFIQN